MLVQCATVLVVPVYLITNYVQMTARSVQMAAEHYIIWLLIHCMGVEGDLLHILPDRPGGPRTLSQISIKYTGPSTNFHPPTTALADLATVQCSGLSRTSLMEQVFGKVVQTSFSFMKNTVIFFLRIIVEIN